VKAPGRGWRHRDHARGRLLPSLLVLALPLLASSLVAGVGFQLVELAFLARLGEAPMAAVIIVNQSLRQTLFLVVMGASFGSQALIARSVGEGRLEAAEHVAGQLVLLGVLFWLLVAAAGLAIPEQLFALAGPDPAFAPYGVPYLRLSFLLCFGMLGSQFFGAILGGAGDTATPLFVLLVQTAVSVLLEWMLIFGRLGAPALGVEGVALGLACGQGVGLAIALVVLFRGRARVHLRRRHLVPDPRMLRRILSLSWPPALQMGGSVVMVFAFLRLAGSYGDTVQAAYAIGLRLGMIAPAVSFPLATACATLVAQSLGAGDVPRAWRSIGIGLAVHGTLMLGFALAVAVWREPILALVSSDPEVRRVGSEYLLYAAGGFAMWAFFFVFLRALQGAGDVLVPMVISLANVFCVSIPLAHGLSRGLSLGPTGIWIAHLVGTVVVTLASGAWLATGRWARRGRQQEDGAA
jgi:putative MATE family efflux protein